LYDANRWVLHEDEWQNNKYFDSNGIIYSNSSFRAPIFYDQDNTGYYVDPASTSVLNILSNPALSDSKLYLRGKSDDNHYLWNAGDDWEEMVMYQGTGFRVTSSAGGGTLLYCYGSANGNYVLSSTSFRAPIFYDSDNTGYYSDPAGTSNLNSLYIQGGVAGVANTSYYYDAAVEVRERGFGGAQDDTWATAPRIGFHWGGRVASQIAMSSSGRISILNNPGNSYEDFIANITYGNASVRGPVFYDSNDTAYYCDPNGTSHFNTINMESQGSGNTNAIYFYDSYKYIKTDAYWMIIAAHANEGIKFRNQSGTDVFYINHGTTNYDAWFRGNITAYSDERVKKDWTPVCDNFVERLAQVKSGIYTRIDTEERNVGVTAQSLQKVLPEAVVEDLQGMLAVNYGNAALVSSIELAKVVMEQQQTISKQQAMIDRLESLVQALINKTGE
jgi:hypothetical protein